MARCSSKTNELRDIDPTGFRARNTTIQNGKQTTPKLKERKKERKKEVPCPSKTPAETTPLETDRRRSKNAAPLYALFRISYKLRMHSNFQLDICMSITSLMPLKFGHGFWYPVLIIGPGSGNWSRVLHFPNSSFNAVIEHA